MVSDYGVAIPMQLGEVIWTQVRLMVTTSSITLYCDLENFPSDYNTLLLLFCVDKDHFFIIIVIIIEMDGHSPYRTNHFRLANAGLFFAKSFQVVGFSDRS